jgi:hypothetical protein
MIVKVERARAPRTQPGAQGVVLARPRIVGRYLGEGHRPGVHVYAVDDMERLLRSVVL